MKLKKLSIICASLTGLILISNVFADSQESFVRKVVGGGPVSQSIQTTDGNFAYLNGHFNEFSITKVSDLSAKKVSEVSLTFDLPDYVFVSLRGMAQTLNGFALVGLVEDGYYGSTSAIVVKVNLEGRVEWNRQINISGKIGFDSVIPTADGGFIVTGWTYPVDEHPVLIKFSSSGDVLWSKSFDSLSWSFQSKATLDGGIILAADLIRIDGQFIGVKVIKINGSGNLVWAVTLGMEEFSLQSLTSLSDQRYLLAGKARDPNRLLLVSLNADGTFHSKAAYSLNVPDFSISSLAQTPDGGIAIGGLLKKKSGSVYDGFLLKINDRQKLIFQKRLGFRDSKERIASVIAKEDGSYLLFASTGQNTLLVRLNSEGIVPGCSFSYNFSASKVLFGNIKHQNLTITPNVFLVQPEPSFDVTSKRLNRPISDVCVN